MRAVTLSRPGEVAIEERPAPSLTAPTEAIVQVEASGICGSDLHILHGRVPVEPGFTLGHEFVGTVVEVGEAVRRVEVGERVLGTFHTACGSCFYCRESLYQKCDDARIYGHGASLGDLQGAQAERVLVPYADMTLRRVPEGLADTAALFAGDVLGTGYHAIAAAGLRAGQTCAVIGLGPVGLCAVMAARAAGAAHVLAIDTVAQRLELAASLGAAAAHATDDDVRRVAKQLSGGRGVDVVVDAVGSAQALDVAVRLARKGGTLSLVGVHAGSGQVNLGLVRLKSLTLVTGHANVIGHLDDVLSLLTSGVIDVSPLVTDELPLSRAQEAYDAYDRREALKVVLRP